MHTHAWQRLGEAHNPAFTCHRLRHRSVDALGGGGQGAAAAANPRLLIPVILVLGANRWNELKGDEFGVHLAILPELLGFFTYKAAVVGLQFTALMREFIGRDFQGQKARQGAAGCYM